ncbi:hypothetical protein BDZ91DRAFT_733884 [Kalaharituber pfeilii]|nr:hypothetical protein BDZ91DRAFT_733884 [Kalaharituber pfeilii]
MTDVEISKTLVHGLKTYFPGLPDYARSVCALNELDRYKTPVCAIKAATTENVRAAVWLAKNWRMKLTVKTSGHSYAGFSNNLDGILLDMSGMTKVSIQGHFNPNSDDNIMILQGGALWGDAYKYLIDHNHNRHIVIGGRCSSVGASGFILGVGLSPFTRSYGMGMDQLKEVTMITAEGYQVKVNDNGELSGDFPAERFSPDNGKDLLWALRGGGGGNFGIVIEMKIKVRKLNDAAGKVVAGKFALAPGDELNEVVKSLYLFPWSSQLPELNVDTMWICEPYTTRVPFVTKFTFYYNGTFDNFKAKIRDSTFDTRLKNLFIERAVEENITQFLRERLPEHWAEEERRYCPVNKTYKLHSSFIFRNDEQTISAVTLAIKRCLEKFNKKFSLETAALFDVTMIHGSGRASVDKTAFPWREGVYFGYIYLQWVDESLNRAMVAFYKESIKEFYPHSIDKKAAFINFTDRSLTHRELKVERDYQHGWYEAYYKDKDNWKRLLKVKKLWDPHNLFDFEQGIKEPVEGYGEEAEQDELGPMLFADIRQRWESDKVPTYTFDDLVRDEGHSCPKCSAPRYRGAR